MTYKKLDRREFLAFSAAATGALSACGRPALPSDLDEFLQKKMETDHIPGLAAGMVKKNKLVWSKGYGWANLTERIPMSPDTLQNIGSISKTFTTTALMQLWEKGKFQLDDDVSDYLSFEVRHPDFADAAITFRHLMTHRSSIDDGSAYSEAYACGDPKTSLGSWMEAYLTTTGVHYNPEENFHPWAPEGGWSYCNVAYGLLAHLVEKIADAPFGDYCKTHIFEPLGMGETSWYLADIDTARHAVPYSYVLDDGVRGPSWGGTPLGVIGEGDDDTTLVVEGYRANCLYNHPNYPDGFLRTSVRQLSQYLLAYINRGTYGDHQLLKEKTVREILTVQFMEGRRAQGLTWYAEEKRDGEWLWGHGGSDPGINADVRLRLSLGAGAIVLVNTNGIRPHEVTSRLLTEIKEVDR